MLIHFRYRKNKKKIYQALDFGKRQINKTQLDEKQYGQYEL